MEIENILNLEPGGYLEDQFIMITERLATVLNAEGAHVKPYLSGTPHFKKLSPAVKVNILSEISAYLDLCEAQIAEGYELRDNLSFTWRAFRKLGLTPTSDALSFIEDEDLIEIYSYENKQLYRNFKFFDLSFYTLEELYCVEWYILYERNQAYTDKILEGVIKIFSAEIATWHPDLGFHLLTEIQNEQRRSFQVKNKLISPLKSHGRIEAVLNITTVKPI